MHWVSVLRATVVEAVGESHHVDGHRAPVGTVEHPLLRHFGVKGNLPEGLKMESVEKDQAGLICQRSRYQELGDGSCWRRHNRGHKGFKRQKQRKS